MITVLERFEKNIETIPECGCWIWTGFTRPSGYGVFGINGRGIPSHRAAWEIYQGTIPKGLHVCHRCDIPSCVNPRHLFLGTHQDNMNDIREKNKARLGYYSDDTMSIRITKDMKQGYRKLTKAEKKNLLPQLVLVIAKSIHDSRFVASHYLGEDDD